MRQLDAVQNAEEYDVFCVDPGSRVHVDTMNA